MGYSLLTKRISPVVAGELSWTPLATDVGRRHGSGVGETEAFATRTVRTATTFSRLQVLVSANDADDDIVIALRKNGLTQAFSVTIPAGQTGIFPNTSNSVTYAAGDTCSIQIDATATTTGTITGTRPHLIQMLVDCGDETVTFLNAVGGFQNTASTTEYTGLTLFGDVDTTEADKQSRVEHAGVIRNAFIRCGLNTRTTDTVCRLRVNGVDTAVTRTISGGATGTFEDTTNSVAVSAGDLVSWRRTLGTGSGDFGTSIMVVELVSDDEREFMLYLGDTVGGAQSFAAGTATQYIGLGGSFFDTGTSEAGTPPELRLTLSKLAAYARANTLTADTTLTVRKDDADTVQAVTWGSGVSGWQTDTGTAEQILPDDVLNYQLEIGATGTAIELVQASMLATLVHEVTVTPSANIAASGENTTAQFAAPAGKTTGDFGGGRISDDENPGDAVDLATDEYREDEWALKVRDTVASGVQFEFRVVSGGAPLDTYTEVPIVTIGSPVDNDRLACMGFAASGGGMLPWMW